MSHTILLIQPDRDLESRTYSDYENIEDCLEDVCRIYETFLKRKNPDVNTITYEIQDLFEFLDSLSDLSCLVYQIKSKTYYPYNRSWIKEKVYLMLRRQANASSEEE